MIARPALQRLGRWLVRMGTPPHGQDKADQSASAMDQRLRHRIAQDPTRPTVLAGSIQLLGLRDLKKMVGDSWAAANDRALQIAEATITRHLSTDDEYRRYDDDTFILVFAELDRYRAEQRTNEIAEEIRDRLLNEVPEAEIEVGQQVAAIDAKLALDSGSVVRSIAQQLHQIREERHANYDRLRRALLAQAQIVYAPVGSPRKRAVLMYRCMLDQATGQMTLKQMRDISTPKEMVRALFDIDCIILGRVVQQLHSAIHAQGKMLFLVPVHFRTLRERGLREEYMDLCKAVPAPYSQCLLFELHSIPSDILSSRVLDLAGSMRAHGSGVVIRADVTSLDLQQAANHGVFGIAVDAFANHECGDGFAEELARLVNAAKPLRLKTFVHDANSVGAAEACYRAEVDYVDGEAIAQKVAAPRGVYHWGPQ